MENTPTDTPSARSSQWEIDYWSTIDRVDMELSGLPLKYHSAEEMADSLGAERYVEYKLLYVIRKRLTKSRDNIEQDGQL